MAQEELLKDLQRRMDGAIEVLRKGQQRPQSKGPHSVRQPETRPRGQAEEA